MYRRRRFRRGHGHHFRRHFHKLRRLVRRIGYRL